MCNVEVKNSKRCVGKKKKSTNHKKIDNRKKVKWNHDLEVIPNKFADILIDKPDNNVKDDKKVNVKEVLRDKAKADLIEEDDRFVKLFDDKSLKMMEKQAKVVEDKMDNLEDKLFPISINDDEKKIGDNDVNVYDHDEYDNNLWNEEQWLNWFHKEVTEGEEQVKAKTIRTETTTKNEGKKDSNVPEPSESNSEILTNFADNNDNNDLINDCNADNELSFDKVSNDEDYIVEDKVSCINDIDNKCFKSEKEIEEDSFNENGFERFDYDEVPSTQTKTDVDQMNQNLDLKDLAMNKNLNSDGLAVCKNQEYNVEEILDNDNKAKVVNGDPKLNLNNLEFYQGLNFEDLEFFKKKRSYHEYNREVNVVEELRNNLIKNCRKNNVNTVERRYCIPPPRKRNYTNLKTVGRVAGCETSILIDTGASSSLISENLWMNIGRPRLKKDKYPTRWCSASGEDLQVLGEVELNITLLEEEHLNNFTVVKKLTYDCIMGMDLLHKFGLIIDLVKHRMKLTGPNQYIPIKIFRKEQSVMYQVNQLQSITLSPRSRYFIRGRIDEAESIPNGTTCLVESCQKHPYLKIACSLNQVGDNNEVIYEVYNLAEEEVTLAKKIPIVKVTLLLQFTEVNSLKDLEERELKKKESDVNNVCNMELRDLADENKNLIDEDKNLADESKNLEDDHNFEVHFKDSSLTKEQKQKLIKELTRFKDVFVTSSKAPGRTPYLKFRIDTEDHKPIRNNPYRISKRESDIMEQEINQYLQLGLIRISQSPWSSPVLMIRKPDGGIRFCIDCRKLNSITVKDSYPLPRIDDLLDVLGGAEYFSSMDIASGYWNVPMHEDSIEKTAFSCKFGLYEWVVMPFGLTNAPAAFQKLMDQVLMNLKWKICLVYLDDCVIFSKNFDVHLAHIVEVLSRFRNAGFKLKMKKCHWGRRSIPFLGHIVTNRGILPNPAKVITVMRAKPPTDVSTLRSFTGLTSYFRRFIKGYAKIAGPLEELKKKSVEWNWDKNCQHAFEELKLALCKPPILAYPRWNEEFILHTNACVNSIGAVLLQRQDKKERVIAYAGRVTSNRERRYGITELECLAVVFGVKKFRCYLEGNHFTLITDHTALVWLFKTGSRSNNRMLMRWVLELQSYEFVVKYRPGEQHGDADGISRIIYDQLLPRSSNDDLVAALKLRSGKKILRKDEVDRANQVQADLNNDDRNDGEELNPSLNEVQNDKTLSMEEKSDLEKTFVQLSKNGLREEDEFSNPYIYELYIEQRNSTWMLPIILYLEQGLLPLDNHQVNFIKRNHELYNLDEEGILMKKVKIDKRLRRSVNENNNFVNVIVLPYKFCEEVLQMGHDDRFSGHLGRLKTYERIRSRYFWPKMKSDIFNYVDSCGLCGRYKGERNFRFGKRQPMNDYSTMQPFDFIVADAVGPLPETKNKNRYLITITDYFSRWAEAIPVRDLKSSTWIVVLENFICRFGVPIKLLTDQGGNFISDLAKDFYKLLGISKKTSTGYHPETQGLDERINGTLIKILKMYVEDHQKDWDLRINCVLFAYRTAYHETLKDSPFFVVYGREPRIPMDVRFLNSNKKIKKGSIEEYR